MYKIATAHGCRYITNDKFYFLPVRLARTSKPEVLEIDRVNFEFNLIGKIASNYTPSLMTHLM